MARARGSCAARRIFHKTDHGFSVLLDSPDPHVAAMVEEALTDAIAFLKTHL